MTQPNIIVFFTDQQRHDTTGLHNNPLNLTPNFDRMARSGTDVHYSFTCQPVCGPARSSMQTGLYATQTGCFKNGIPLWDKTKTLAHYFAEAGYDTAYIGKWHLAGDSAEPVPQEKRGGYDYWLASNLLEFTSDAYQTRLWNNDNQAVDLPGYRVDAITDAAIRYIDNSRNKPFYLFISYIEPHHQNHRDDYPAPMGYSERYQSPWMPPDLMALRGSSHQHLPGYYGMVKRLDEALGRLVDTLISLNMLEDTIILFTSDHACHFKTRNDEYKRSCHESSIRVPTMFYGREFTGGGRINQLVSLVDLPPTLLDACNLYVPDVMQGHSLMSLIRKEPTDRSDDIFVQISESQIGRAIRTKRWKYAVAAPGITDWEAPATSKHYVETALYDLQADPYELNNLVGLETHRYASDILKKRLIKRMLNAGEVEPEIDNAPIIKGNPQLIVSEEDAHA